MSNAELEQARNLKQLELLQSVITRMAQNSFLIKGWAITLCSALLALSGKDSRIDFAALPVVPALVFWGIDAYYLAMERRFRLRYDALAAPLNMLLMERTPEQAQSAARAASWGRAMFSRTVFPIYGIVILVALLILCRTQATCPFK